MGPFLPYELTEQHRQRLREEFEACGFAGHRGGWFKREARKVERRARRDARRAARRTGRLRPSC